MRGSSPRMTQHVWRGQSVTVDPASVAPRLNEVIAGLDPAIHDAVRTRLSHSVASRLKEVIAGLDPAIHDAAPECLTIGSTC